MSTELATINPAQLPANPHGTADDFANAVKRKGWLPNLKLFQMGPAIDNGLINRGEWGIEQTKTEIKSLGRSCDVLVFGRRLKAVDWTDRSNVITSIDPQSAEYVRIAAEADAGSEECSYGVSFLAYERTHARFVELFFASHSARPVAGDVYPYMLGEGPPTPITLASNARQNKKGASYLVPTVAKCSLPFSHGPTQDELADELKRFYTVKQAEEVEAPQRAR